jgi:spore germination cell wall hydrolase CwlJ-like protein
MSGYYGDSSPFLGDRKRLDDDITSIIKNISADAPAKSRYKPRQVEVQGLGLAESLRPKARPKNAKRVKAPAENATTGPLRPVPRRNAPLPADTPVRDILAKTLAAEAGKEGYDGMLAVGSVIANRVNSKNYGNSLRDVILQPGQFSAWNSVTGYAGGEQGQHMGLIKPSDTAYAVADAILSGNYESPVGKATHYYNPKVSTPKWGKEAGGDWQTLGNHIFGYGN